MEKTFASGQNPVPAANRLLSELQQLMLITAECGETRIVPSRVFVEGLAAEDRGDTETGEHYGRLFSAFDRCSYWDEPIKLLRQRLLRNQLALPTGTERVLDAGCGGGRYTVAWRMLGAAGAIGIDFSKTGVVDANRRITLSDIDGVSYAAASVLHLPFADSSFDVVFSNGVLHHTVDWQAGMAELLRVLKPGGFGWCYVIEQPGGLFWDLIEVLRLIMRDVPRSLARATLGLLGLPSNRIFYMLDHVMVPINLRLRPDQVEHCLETVGAVTIRRLTRGADFDRVEKIHSDEPYAEIKFGVGENRYVFSK